MLNSAGNLTAVVGNRKRALSQKQAGSIREVASEMKHDYQLTYVKCFFAVEEKGEEVFRWSNRWLLIFLGAADAAD
jgi:hypothetical protein